MSLILNIDTTSEQALVNIAKDGIVLFEETNDSQKDHAAFLHPSVLLLLEKARVTMNDISAVAVSHGPGSYTGIRVGMASAKGLCYATGKPLITVNQLEILAQAAIDLTTGNYGVYCPVIDARRLEVFTAVYDSDGKELVTPVALVLHHNSFHDFLAVGKVLFCGSGVSKWRQLCTDKNAVYTDFLNKGLAFAKLSFEMYQQSQFANLAYASPLYIKDFYTTAVAR